MYSQVPRDQSRLFLGLRKCYCVSFAARFSVPLQYMAELGVRGGESVTCFVSAEIARGQPQPPASSLQPDPAPSLYCARIVPWPQLVTPSSRGSTAQVGTKGVNEVSR